MASNETTYNKILGIRNNRGDYELVVLEYTFDDSDTFRGATGYTMNVITQDEVDSRNSEDNVDKEMWKMAVSDNHTEEGLYDWWAEKVEQAEMEGLLFPYDDSSFRYETEKMYDNLSEDDKALIEEFLGVKGEDYVTFVCQSCGRVFNSDDEWVVELDEDLVKKVKEMETKVPC